MSTSLITYHGFMRKCHVLYYTSDMLDLNLKQEPIITQEASPSGLTTDRLHGVSATKVGAN